MNKLSYKIEGDLLNHPNPLVVFDGEDARGWFFSVDKFLESSKNNYEIS